ncbi:MAG: ATP-binding protein [Bacteroidia bacterium]
MKNVIGNPARGKNFFPRKSEVAKILRALNAGSNIQVVAPRRVGKTSILYHLLEVPNDDFIFVYADMQSVISETEYYKVLLKSISKAEAIKKERTWFDQAKWSKNKFLKRIKSISILNGEMEFTEQSGIDYCEEFSDFIRGLDLGNRKLVLLVDEFPYAILNILKHSKETEHEARNLLKSNRLIRQEPDLNDKLKLIYTGSIGLNSIVSKLDATALINDLIALPVNPLSKKEAKDLVKLLLKTDCYTIEEIPLNHLLDKIQWFIPFHLQLFINEVYNFHETPCEITSAMIDKSIDALLLQRNKPYFEHYFSRLKEYYKGNELKYALEILSITATKNKIETSQIHDLAVKHKVQSYYKDIIETLVYDGYINNSDDEDCYIFNSFIVKLWWKKYAS